MTKGERQRRANDAANNVARAFRALVGKPNFAQTQANYDLVMAYLLRWMKYARKKFAVPPTIKVK